MAGLRSLALHTGQVAFQAGLTLFQFHDTISEAINSLIGALKAFGYQCGQCCPDRQYRNYYAYKTEKCCVNYVSHRFLIRGMREGISG